MVLFVHVVLIVAFENHLHWPSEVTYRGDGGTSAW